MRDVRKERRKQKRWRYLRKAPDAPLLTEWESKIYYLSNCLFWIKDLTRDGKAHVIDKKGMMEVIISLEAHCRSMKEMLSNDQEVQVSDTTGSEASNQPTP